MAEDTNKKLGSQENEEPQKDWEWDAQTPDAPVETVEIESFDIPAKAEAVEEAPEKEDDKSSHQPGTCEICGEKLKNSPSEYYCNICREKYLKVNYGASHIILSVVMMFVTVIGIVAFASTSKLVTNIHDARVHLKSGHYSRAIDSYNNVETTAVSLNDGFNAFLQGISQNFKEVKVFDSGKIASQELAYVLVKNMTSEYAAREAFMNIVDSSFTEKELNSANFADVKACYDFCKSMDNTANATYDAWYALLEERLSAFDENGKLTKDDVPSVEEIIAVLDEYAQKHPEAEPSTLEFYKMWTVYYEASSTDSLKDSDVMTYLNSTYDKAGKYGYFYSDYYLSMAWECEEYDSMIKVANETLKVNPANESAYFFLTKTYGQQEKWDEASAVCEEILKYNPDSLDYYTLKAEVLRRTGDYSASTDICKKGLKAGEDSELYRQASISYMLNEETEKALEAAKSAYESTYAASYSGGTISLEVLNTSALISYLCDSEKVMYDEIIQMLDGQGYDLEDSVKSVIKGDTTFEDLFTTGKGDI